MQNNFSLTETSVEKYPKNSLKARVILFLNYFSVVCAKLYGIHSVLQQISVQVSKLVKN